MGSNEKFCLRWNDFESNISVAFREIREEKDFFDCTLSCGSRQIQAHKLILSACSPFFRSILKQNPHQHPLLYMKGVEFTNLIYVLNFMYHGEVNVAQEELNSFLSVAEDLQVKGLTQSNSPGNSNTKQKPDLGHKPLLQKEPSATPPPKRPRPLPPPPSQPSYQPASDEIQEIVPVPVVKMEPLQAPVTRVDEGVMETMRTEEASMEENFAVEGYNEYEGFDGQYYEGYDGFGEVESGEQNKGLPNQNDNINDQILEDAAGLGYTCALCGKGFGVNRNHCRRHIKNYHNQRSTMLACDICKKCYKNKDSLRHHQRTTHGLYQH